MRLLIASSPSRRCLSMLSLVALVLPAFVRQAVAQQSLPVAKLMSFFPPGAKQGATLDVTISGDDLEKVSKLHFSDPAISAVQQTQPPALGQEGPQPAPGKFT